MEILAHASRQLVQALKGHGQVLAELKPGDTVSAQIIGRSPSGSTLLSVAGQQVSVALPSALTSGTVLNLLVQSTTQGLQFSIVSQTPPNIGTAQASSTLIQSAQPGQPGQTPAVQNSVSPQAVLTSNALQPAPAPSAPSGTQALPVIGQSTDAALFTGLKTGDILTAQVVNRTPDGQTIISVAGRQIPVSLSGSATPGASLTLQVQNGQQGLQLAIIPTSTSASDNGALGGTPSTRASTATAAPQPGAAPNDAQTLSQASPPVATISPALAPLLSQTTISALGNQNSVAALVASVLRLGNRGSEFPQPVQDAILSLKSQVLPLSEQMPTTSSLQTAVARSGIFMESRLAAGPQQNPASQPGPSAVPGQAMPLGQGPALQGDLKVILLLLKGTLSNWLGDGAFHPPASKPPHPPARGAAPRSAHLHTLFTPTHASEQQIAQSLLAKTESALSRLHLLQLASLPDSDTALPLGKAEWQVELPFSMGQNAGTLNLQINRDDHKEGASEEARGWRMRFALNAGGLGEVGAEVSFLGGNTSVVLWAERPETAKAMEAALPDLQEGLLSQGLKVGSVRIRHPSVSPQPEKNTGNYLDVGT